LSKREDNGYEVTHDLSVFPRAKFEGNSQTEGTVRRLLIRGLPGYISFVTNWVL